MSTFMHQVGGIGGVEWLFIIIIILVLFFGVKKIPEIARSVGKASAEYEKARIQAKHELEQVQLQKNTNDKAAAAEDRKKLESIAKVLDIDSTNKSDDELRASIESEITKGKHSV
jgi:sec-independent protein translocase protein TatA